MVEEKKHVKSILAIEALIHTEIHVEIRSNVEFTICYLTKQDFRVAVLKKQGIRRLVAPSDRLTVALSRLIALSVANLHTSIPCHALSVL